MGKMLISAFIWIYKCNSNRRCYFKYYGHWNPHAPRRQPSHVSQGHLPGVFSSFIQFRGAFSPDCPNFVSMPPSYDAIDPFFKNLFRCREFVQHYQCRFSFPITKYRGKLREIYAYPAFNPISNRI